MNLLKKSSIGHRLVILTDVERQWWCKHCQEYFAVKGIGDSHIHKECGYLTTKEEKDERLA